MTVSTLLHRQPAMPTASLDGDRRDRDGHHWISVRAAVDDAGGYTVIGRVTSGLDELRAGVTDAGPTGGASDGAPSMPVTITSFTLE